MNLSCLVLVLVRSDVLWCWLLVAVSHGSDVRDAPKSLTTPLRIVERLLIDGLIRLF